MTRIKNDVGKRDIRPTLHGHLRSNGCAAEILILGIRLSHRTRCYCAVERSFNGPLTPTWTKCYAGNKVLECFGSGLEVLDAYC
jgi:hypothetical protein